MPEQTTKLDKAAAERLGDLIRRNRFTVILPAIAAEGAIMLTAAEPSNPLVGLAFVGGIAGTAMGAVLGRRIDRKQRHHAEALRRMECFRAQ